MGKKQPIEELIRQLQVHSSRDEHQEVLECAGNILHQTPDDASALHSKLVALLKLDRFSEAFNFVRVHQSVATAHPVEYAYALYKSGHIGLLFEEFKVETTTDRKLLHILAQAHYQQESLEVARGIYEKIISGTANASDVLENEPADLVVNRAAVDALEVLSRPDNSRPIFETDPSSKTYDFLFNEATYLLGNAKYDEALDLLRQAKLACSNSPLLSTPQEVAEELAPILIQASYAQSLMGNIDEAISTLEAVGITSLPEGPVKLVAVNNLIALKQTGGQSGVEAAKSAYTHLNELKTASGDVQSLPGRLVGVQHAVLGDNKHILKYRTGQGVKPSKSAKAGASSELANVLGLLVKSGLDPLSSTSEAISVNELRKVSPKSTSAGALGLALAQGDFDAANLDAAAFDLEQQLASLKATSESKYLPGLIGALVSVFTDQGRKPAALALIKDAFKAWTDEGARGDDLIIPAQILAEADDEELRNEAFSYLQNIVKTGSSAPLISAAVLSTGHEQATTQYESIASQLPSIDTLVDGINAERLNEHGVTSLKRSLDVTTSRTVKKRKRQGKLPKDHDASKPADPERWLPKRDRTTWKPKRKDKRNAKTQGGGVVDTSTESGISSAPASTVVQSKSSVAKNKKKKKGKK